MITRRQLVKHLGVGSLVTLGGFPVSYLVAQSPTTPQNTLAIPPQLAGTASAGVQHFNLHVQAGSSRFMENADTPTLGINGNYLGPTLRFNRNDKVALHVDNGLAEPTTLHWHGFHLPATEDGGPHQVVEPGTVWTARFDVVQFAGTFWYHSHMMDKSGEQVYQGLAGMIIVDEPEQSYPLPNVYGVDDIPVIVQDRRFDDDGTFRYMNLYEDMVVGMRGETILVNGTVNPVFEASTRFIRLRLLNASNARTYTFALSDRRQFYQIASDGGLLSGPVPMTTLELAVAERAEILVELRAGEEVKLVNEAVQSGFPEFPGAMSQMMRELDAQNFDILTLRAQSQLADNIVLPESLTSIYRLPEAAATTTRRFQLSMGSGMRSGEDRGPGRGNRNGGGGGHGGGNFLINGRRMAEDFINETIELNTTEIWELTNNSPMMHPFHVHNGQFQLLDRNGVAPPANEMGWKDTVRVGSGERVRIIMRFTDFSNAEAPYMYHCHILEHEDRGMMGQFVVV